MKRAKYYECGARKFEAKANFAFALILFLDAFSCSRATGLLFILLMIGTLWLSIALFRFRSSPYLSQTKRNLLSDYAYEQKKLALLCDSQSLQSARWRRVYGARWRVCVRRCAARDVSACWRECERNKRRRRDHNFCILVAIRARTSHRSGARRAACNSIFYGSMHRYVDRRQYGEQFAQRSGHKLGSRNCCAAKRVALDSWLTVGKYSC